MDDITISMPLSITIGNKKHSINLNPYRNLHYQVLNKLKKEYKEIVGEQIEWLRFDGKIKLTFILWKRDRRKIDRANPLSIHEKFFCDALVDYGCIPDDNDDYISSSHYYTGGIDKKNPRVDIIITGVK